MKALSNVKFKFYWLFSLLVLVLGGCSGSDENPLVGKWKYYRLEKDGTVFLSDDTSERRKIIDKHLNENDRFIKDVFKFRENAEKEMDTRLDVHFELKADSTAIISDFTQGADIQNWDYTVDEDAKTISFVTDDRTFQYDFKLERDMLTFVDKQNRLKITLKKEEE